MRGAKSAKWVASAIVVALAATACGGNDSSNDGGKGEVDPNGVFRLTNSEPQGNLQPANSRDTASGQVIKGLFSQLVDYKKDGSAELVYVNAESVETEDNRTWTVKLKKGWKFHDGEEVTSKSFVDAWNWAANIDNNQQNSYWFADIKGYEDVHPSKGKPKAKEMSGLKVVDDHTFTIELTEPVTYFNYKLAYSAWSPLPSKFYDDPKAYGDKPVGNGPYKFVSWERKKKITLERYDEYQGPDKAENGGVELVVYNTLEAQYQAVASEKADVITQIPPRDLPKYRQDFGDRAIDAPMAGVQSIVPVFYGDQWKLGDEKNAKLRQGLSMAIDRKTITDKVLNGSRVPATGFVGPNVLGFQEGVLGEVAEYNPEKAKKTIEDAGGVPGNKVHIQYNADGGHKEWVEAVCNNIRQNTGVECIPDAKVDFQTDLNTRDAKKVKSMYRGGWVLDYPVNVNFMRELYETGADSNTGFFSSKKVDELFKKGDSAADLDGTVKAYQEAEKELVKEMPAIPLWYYSTQAAHSKKVNNVEFDLANFLLMHKVKVVK
ncbi:ABC transporter substrate-binding protein [Streptomyces sp. OF3]|uniref:ABC transporter substrate-binding protein n=1 Tax=Streptomyces alkaliterrae TaxID=2213162 RepID=A0A7W3WKC3_9ACTN|nr:ABC transporter substrate-binding protein [Streptomyces alkaliterrae]MBB1253913.1 ABC transporter substrate-binding protein [Streptomyces alkaliterrae]